MTISDDFQHGGNTEDLDEIQISQAAQHVDNRQQSLRPGERPRDIQERTLEFACEIVKLYDFLQKRRGAARSLSRQVLKSGTAIGSNLQEADGGESRADFISKCSISLKESRETQYWLKVLMKSGSVRDDRVAWFLKESGELVAILTTIVKNARNRPPN